MMPLCEAYTHVYIHICIHANMYTHTHARCSTHVTSFFLHSFHFLQLQPAVSPALNPTCSASAAACTCLRAACILSTQNRVTQKRNTSVKQLCRTILQGCLILSYLLHFILMPASASPTPASLRAIAFSTTTACSKTFPKIFKISSSPFCILTPASVFLPVKCTPTLQLWRCFADSRAYVHLLA